MAGHSIRAGGSAARRPVCRPGTASTGSRSCTSISEDKEPRMPLTVINAEDSYSVKRHGPGDYGSFSSRRVLISSLARRWWWRLRDDARTMSTMRSDILDSSRRRSGCHDRSLRAWVNDIENQRIELRGVPDPARAWRAAHRGWGHRAAGGISVPRALQISPLALLASRLGSDAADCSAEIRLSVS